ncbi:DUF4206 domain containing protein-like protein, partial [Leptotrombidium deliense]
ELPNNQVQLQREISQYMKLIRVQNTDEETKMRLIKRLCDLRVKQSELSDENDELSRVCGHLFRRDDERETLCSVCFRKPRFIPLPPLLRRTLNQCVVACSYCDFFAHQSCLKNKKRVIQCPKGLFTDAEAEGCPQNKYNPLLILKICPETGLASQDFKCFDCNESIQINNALKCDYNGKYYCENCHSSNMSVIPARVIHNWDFEQRLISNKSMFLLNYIKSKPVLFDILELNSMLYGLVEELCHIKRIRQELCLMVKYIKICKQPSKPKLSVATHLFDEEKINCYSLNELTNVRELQIQLLKLHQTLLVHITKDCESCKGKGFYCELCRDRQDLLFPFSSNIANCQKCSAVYHKNCYHRKSKCCPRCKRLCEKESQINGEESLNVAD